MDDSSCSNCVHRKICKYQQDFDSHFYGFSKAFLTPAKQACKYYKAEQKAPKEAT